MECVLLCSESEFVLVVGIHFVSPRYDPSRLTGWKTSSTSLSLKGRTHWAIVNQTNIGTGGFTQKSCIVGNLWETGWSAHGLSWALRYHLEVRRADRGACFSPRLRPLAVLSPRSYLPCSSSNSGRRGDVCGWMQRLGCFGFVFSFRAE